MGIDLHEQAISTAKSLASQRNLERRAEFRVVNASEPLPFPNAHFDAITCADAINHIPNRPLVLAQWARLLKPGGRLLFTDLLFSQRKCAILPVGNQNGGASLIL